LLVRKSASTGGGEAGKTESEKDFDIEWGIKAES